MKHMIKKEVSLAFLLALVLPTVAFAVPQLPASFYGTVTINDRPAEVSSVIIAEINGLQKGSIVIDEAGKYGGLAAAEGKLHVFEADNGDTILFYIQTPSMSNRLQSVETAVFSSGSLDELDLTFTGDEIAISDESPGSGGGGGSVPGTPDEDIPEDGNEGTIPLDEVQSNVFDIEFESSGIAILEMATGDEAKFTLKGEAHSVKVKSIGQLAVLLTISSDPFDVIVNKEETKNVDLNKDGTDDLAITLNKISGNSVELTFERLWTVQEAGVNPITGMVTGAALYQFGIILVVIILGGGAAIYIFRKK